MSTSKYPNGSIYLSGGMQFAENLGSGWRQVEGHRLIELGFYPIDISALDIHYTNMHGDLYRNVSDEELAKRKSQIRRHFIETDINLIRNESDAVIVYYDESVRLGAGTFSEVHDAYYHKKIPVFLVNGYPTLDDIPGWLQAEATKIFSNFDELNKYLETLPPGILKRDLYGNTRSDQYYLCSLCGAVEEKHGSHFVSKVEPLYCKSCVEIVKHTYEELADRYAVFRDIIARDFEE